MERFADAAASDTRELDVEVSASPQTPGGFDRWCFAAFVAVLFVWNLASALYLVAGLSIPGGLSFVGYLFLSMIVYYWFKRFAHRNGLDVPLDMGWFLYLAWWAIVPIYLFKVHGLRAFRTVLAVVAAYLLAYGLSVLVYYALA